MRYEDSSGAFQASGPIANDDADTLAAGSRGPATGNLITGEGTQYGAASADSAAGAHVAAIAGHGGEDSSFSGGKLSVAGQFGSLTVDAEGNYSYLANKGAPENVRDRFTYTLADNQGNTDTAALIVEIGKTPAVIKADAQQIVPGPDGVVTLPPGVELSDIMVVGRNLVVNLPDGTQLIIVDGAVFVPQLSLGGVEVPATNVAALLVGQEVQPAAGETPPSSGGNFALPPPPLDPGVPLGDLLPPTELTYVPPEPQQVFDILDEEPEIFVQPDGQPASVAAVDQVEEAGLPSRNGNLPNEPAGSGESADGNGADNDVASETTGGTIVYDSPDGVASITLNGVAITSVGQVINGAFGTLTITSIAPGAIGYSYTLRDNTSGNDTHDDFSVVLTDSDGDQASATLRIDIIDDVPTARPDTDSIAAGQFGPATGNVMTDAAAGDAGDSDTNAADTVGADNASVTSVSSVNVPANSDNTFSAGVLQVAGQYGVLTIEADGDYSYTRNPNTPGGVTDTFNYTITDGDGDTSSTTLTISIGDLPITIVPNAVVKTDDDAVPGENGNPGGPEDNVDAENLNGTLSGSGGDGALTFDLLTTGAPAGFSYVDGPNGSVLVQQVQNGSTVTVLTITVNASTGAYTVTQNAPILHPTLNGQPGDDTENNVGFTINYTVSDLDGDTANGTLVIDVDDDTPVATQALLTGVVDEDGLAGGNPGGVNDVDGTATSVGGSVAALFSAGADNPLSYSLLGNTSGLPQNLTSNGVPVTYSVSGNTLTASANGSPVFTFVLNADGSYTFNLLDQLDHPSLDGLPGDDTENEVDIEIPLGSIIQATDTDGDSVTAGARGLVITVDDDSPQAFVECPDDVITVNEVGSTFTGDLNLPPVGADQPGVVSFVVEDGDPVLDNEGNPVTSEGVALFYFVNDAGVLEARAGDATGEVIFTITLNGDGTFTYEQLGVFGEGSGFTFDDLTSTSAGNVEFRGVGADDPDTTVDLLLSGAVSGVDSSVNTDSDSIGTANQSMDVGETIRIDLVSNLTSGAATPSGFGYGGHVASTSFIGLIPQVQGDQGQTVAFTVWALDSNNTQAAEPDRNPAGGFSDATITAVTEVTVKDYLTGNSTTVDVTGFTVGVFTPVAYDISVRVNADGSVTFSGIQQGDSYGFTTGSGDFNAVVVQSEPAGTGGSTQDSFDLGVFSIGIANQFDPFGLEIPIALTDSDGDAVVCDIDINVGVPVDAPDITVTVNEAGLPLIGSDAASNSEIASGDLQSQVTGGTGPYTFTLVSNGNGAFGTLVLNADGTFTYTLDTPFDSQPDANDGTNPELGAETFTFEATDSLGAVQTGTITVNIIDDVPSISASTNQPILTVDETVLATNAAANFAGVFTTVAGADGAATVTYALGTSGGASGLTDTLSGQSVVLVNNAGVIEGRTSGSNLLVFTVSVDASGNVTLDQLRSVVHSDPSNPDDATSLSGDGLVTLTATITDGDGDQDSATANIGQNLVFEDDGPSISASGTEPTLTVDETVLATNATTSFAGAFTPLFGADGPGATPVTYALSINAGATGLVDVATGQAIVLVNNAGVIEGHVGNAAGPLAFTVSVDGSGNVTLDQIRALSHPDAANPDDNVTLASDNLIVLTATAIDGDGDQASAALNIGQNLNFEDDGPSVSASTTQPQLTVDETVLATNASASFAAVFTPLFGADGAAAANSVTYALGINAGATGLVDVATGQAIVLVNNAGVIEGHVGNAAGALAFTVSVDGSGNVTLDQIRALSHPNAANPDDSVTLAADNLITLTATVTDRDGDQATATANIGQNLNFEDDGPSANNDADVTDPLTDQAAGNVISGVGTTAGSGNADAPGADGFGSITNLVGFGGSADNDPAGGFSVNGQYGTLQMDANGNYTYTRTGGPGGATDIFTYTYVDRDGDPATATLTITISDNTPVAGTVNIALDDDVIPGANGNLDGPGDDNPDVVGQNSSGGTLPGSGGDAPLTFGFGANVAPAGFTYDTGTPGTLLIKQGATTVITITIDAATGAYSVTQNAPIVHQAGGDENNQLFAINYTVTDSDTDVANGVINIDVDDDSPVISASGTQPSLTVDETVLATNASASFASVFTNAFGADGPAVAGSITYALGINAGATGLVDVATGQAIVLVNNAGVIEGHVGNAAGALAFTVSVDGSGNVTLDQIRALSHPNAANPDDSVTLAADNLITLSSTITDRDGDTATATANIGQNLNFEDDGPSVSASTTQPQLTVDETVLATNASASFAAVFTPLFGADGAAAANSVTYALGINAGATGLVDVATGQAIVLVNNAGVIEGHVGNAAGALAFTVSVDGSGNVTLDQIRALSHPNAANPDDSVTLAADNLITLTATVTDRDGDQATATANIGQNLNFEDDGPSAVIVETGQGVSVDESVGIQADSNDTTNAAIIALFAGVANTGTDTHLPQYATNASAVVASTGSSYGADGAGTTAFSLNVSSAGVDSGLNTTDGSDILLYKEGSLVVGRVGSQAGPAAFAIAIDPVTGQISMVEYLSIQHPNAANPDDSVSVADGAVQAVVTVTDRDGDSVTSTPTNIGSLISFQDSAPVMTGASNINIQNSGDFAHTGTFAFSLGSDGAATNNDVLSVTGSATVNGAAVTNYSLVEQSENATTAVYSISFDYPNGPATTATATGTVTFNKVLGTYTVDMDQALQGVSIVQTATGTLFQGYEPGTSTPDGSQPAVSVTQVAPNLFVQFTSVAEPSSGTGANNLRTVDISTSTGVTSGTDDTGADAGAWVPGELFDQDASWVSTSNDSNGVAGDTIQGGEVLDFNLYNTNPTGNLGMEATASASSMFLKFDGIGEGEDLIVILKLYDTVTDTYTTKALVVQNSDIQKGPGSGPGIFASITLDNNDGLIVIEPNDYQQGNTNLVIVGAQLAGSDEGITGSGINFNNTTGAGGASVGTQTFATDVGDGPMKISSIGFVTTTTTAQTADLTFNVTVTDGDGDSIMQTVHATITANADSSTPIVLAPSVTTISAAPLSSSKGALVQDDLQKTAANSNTVTMAAAVAAAGMADSAAAQPASDPAAMRTADVAEVSHSGGRVYELSTHDGDGGNAPLAAEPAASEAAAPASSSGRSDANAHDGKLDASANQSSSDDGASHQAANDQGPAVAAEPQVAVAPTVMMASAEQLQAAGLNGDAQKGGSVEKIVAEALGGGDAPTVDGLLAHLPGGIQALAHVASQDAGSVPGWDMAAHGAFGGGPDMLIKVDVLGNHHDALQPAVNG